MPTVGIREDHYPGLYRMGFVHPYVVRVWEYSMDRLTAKLYGQPSRDELKTLILHAKLKCTLHLAKVVVADCAVAVAEAEVKLADYELRALLFSEWTPGRRYWYGRKKGLVRAKKAKWRRAKGKETEVLQLLDQCMSNWRFWASRSRPGLVN